MGPATSVLPYGHGLNDVAPTGHWLLGENFLKFSVKKRRCAEGGAGGHCEHREHFHLPAMPGLGEHSLKMLWQTFKPNHMAEWQSLSQATVCLKDSS